MKKSLFIIALLSLVVLSPIVAFGAAGSATPPSGTGASGSATPPADKPVPTLENPLKVNSVECLVDLVITIALRVAAIIAVLALIWVGFKFVAAQGNPGKIQEAQQMLLAVVIGIAIVFGSKVIIDVVRGTISPIVGDQVIPNVQCND